MKKALGDNEKREEEIIGARCQRTKATSILNQDLNNPLMAQQKVYYSSSHVLFFFFFLPESQALDLQDCFFFFFFRRNRFSCCKTQESLILQIALKGKSSVGNVRARESERAQLRHRTNGRSA